MKKIVLIGLGIFGGSVWLNASSPQSSSPFEALSDVDLNFFSTLPTVVWGRDPFLKTPGFAKAETSRNEEPPHLEAVFFDKKNPTAVVNGTVVSIGDYIVGKRIANIGQNFVLLEENDSTIEISIPPAAITKKVLEIKEHKHD